MSSNFNAAAVVALRDALKTQATSSGLYRSVLMHEPKSSPGNGMTYAMWLGPITQVPGLGGLYKTAGRIEWTGRVHSPFHANDEDLTETSLMHTVLEQIANYSANITLGGTVYAIDLEGMHGPGLEASVVGYVTIGESHYRVADISVPVIIDGLWTQVD